MNIEQRNANKKGFVPYHSSEALLVTPNNKGNVTMNSLAHNALVTIDSINIRTDEQGRYCLNDLHKAAVANGANERTKEPSKFLTSASIIELVQELTDTQILGIAPVSAIKGGLLQGTYVVKELVYAYAMWINAAFHLKVIRTFDAVITGKIQPVDPMAALSDPNMLRGLLLGYSEKVIALEAENQAMKTDVKALDQIAKSDGSFCLLDTAKTLQVKPKVFMNWMQSHSWIYKRAGCAHWVGYQDKIQSGHLEHKTTTVTRGDGSEKIVEQVRVTAKGLTRLAKIFAKGEAA